MAWLMQDLTMFVPIIGEDPNFDIAAKRRKKHKNKISGLVNSICYNEQKSKFRLFTKPSILYCHIYL